MKKLSATGQKWLKSLHIFFASVWVGSAVILIIVQLFSKPNDGGELYGIIGTLDFIDLFILVPGAIGTFFTALIYSIWTNWGWFKHKWITVKWAICIFGIVFGTFWLGPWITEMSLIAKGAGLEALSDSTYLNNRFHSLLFGSFQTATVIFALFISTHKPWRGK
ncbi:MAG: hypothetical protein GX780_04170 [Campylobacteraceae bacterium]|nr:hypothetical protein [Campylobacteraceae bacterium]